MLVLLQIFFQGFHKALHAGILVYLSILLVLVFYLVNMMLHFVLISTML